MPIAIACPSCKARLQAPDSAVGKRVKCPKCQTPIPVPDAGESPAPARQSPAPSKAPGKKSAPDNDFNFDEDDRPAKKSPPAKRRDDDYDDDDDRPSKKGGAIKKSRDDDYDDDDDRPSKKGAIKKGRDDDYDDDDRPSKKAVARKGRDDDYDDYDDDRPKKKGKKGRPAGNFPTPTQEDMSNAFNMYLFAFIANLVVGGAGTLVFFIMWFMKRKESPLVDWHGKQGVNAMVSSLAVFFLMGGLGCAGAFGLGAISNDMAPIGAIVGILFFALAAFYSLWLGICFLIGMFKAKSGEYWKYPLTFQLLK